MMTADQAQQDDSIAVGAAPPARAAGAVHPAIVGLLTLSMVLQLGAARAISFSPEAHGGVHTGAISQLLILVSYVTALSVTATSPDVIQTLRRGWPVAALPVLALASTAWAAYPALTLRSAISYLFTTMLGFAIAVALPPAKALGVVVRAMGYICIISAAYALFLPELGVHQADETVQAVHAGLWRGILVHKVGLGIVSGLTFSLLIFYRTVAYRSFVLWLPAFACATACLWNSGSATGMVTAAMLLTLLYLFQTIARTAKTDRAIVMRVALGALIIFMFFMVMGYLDRLSVLLGRSPDLTGRAEMWPAITDAIRSAPLGMIIGHGYVSGFTNFVAPIIWPILGAEASDCHNGYLEVTVAYGYGGAILVFWIHVWIYRRSKHLLLQVPGQAAKIAAFPMSMLLTGVLINYSESWLLSYASVYTQLTPLVAVWLIGVPMKKSGAR
jgi:exopolysaccharide production protein ExoQ